MATSSLTLRKLPRRMALRVRMPNHVSTWFIQDALVGVKWKVMRGLSASHAFTSGVVWVETLSRTTWSSPAGYARATPPHEGQEVGAGVAGSRVSVVTCPVADLERREQAGRPVARVVVGVPLDLSRAHRQHRLGPVERLDLGLLVDRQHDRPLGRVEVQPHDVADLRLERGIGAELEGLGAVGLERALPPDPVDGGRAHARPRCEIPDAPVGRALGRWPHRERLHPVAVLPRVRGRVTRAGRVGEPVEPRLGVPAAPQLHGHDRDAQLGGDALDRPPSAERSTIRARVTARCSLVARARSPGGAGGPRPGPATEEQQDGPCPTRSSRSGLSARHQRNETLGCSSRARNGSASVPRTPRSRSLRPPEKRQLPRDCPRRGRREDRPG